MIKHGFIPVHYEVFITNLRKIDIDKNNKWQIIFTEMLDTIEGLYLVKRLNEKSIQWINEHSVEVAKYYKKLMK